jgi:peptide/nickel transport system permease protein
MSLAAPDPQLAARIEPGALSAGRHQRWRELGRELAGQRLLLVGCAVLVWWIACAIVGPQIAPASPYAQNLNAINLAPSGGHLFGTDDLGRDMLSRVIVGSREILVIAPLATLLGTIVGAALGLAMGYLRGPFDEIASRFVEAFLALPLVVTGLIAIFAFGRSNTTIILVIGVVFAPLIARTVRAAVISERELEYVAAARLRGDRAPYVMFVEILPNVLAPIVVEFTVRLGYAIFAVATLSFLGFGIQPPSPDWGLEIAGNFGQVTAGYWWEVLFDALAIASLVVAVNLVSDGVEAVLER